MGEQFSTADAPIDAFAIDVTLNGLSDITLLPERMKRL